MRIAIVGGGISGLTAAYFAGQNLSAQLQIFEASPRPGGKLFTVQECGIPVELGAESFVRSKPAAIQLCRQLDLEDQLLSSTRQQAYLYRKKKFHAIHPGTLFNAPFNIQPLIHSELLSAQGIARLKSEPSVPVLSSSDESVASFLSRRLGEEIVERMAGPVLWGIYGASPDSLSAAAVLPELWQMEKERGFVTTQAPPEVPPPGLFVTLRKGLNQLIDCLIQRLADNSKIYMSSPVIGLRRSRESWFLKTPIGETEADAVILAVPAPEAARLLNATLPEVSRLLLRIKYSSAIVAPMIFEGVSPPVSGSGLLISGNSPLLLAACTWVSSKFPARGDENRFLVRSFAPLVERRDPDRILSELIDETRAVMGWTQRPVWSHLATWPRSLPIFSPGHRQRLDQCLAELAEVLCLQIIGNFYRGVGISDCIEEARLAVGNLKKQR